MAGYVSPFETAAGGKSSGGTKYVSPFITAAKAAAAKRKFDDANQVDAEAQAAALKEDQDKAQKAADAKKSSGLGKKVGGLIKGFADAATTSEHTVAKGVARVLPGGTADLEANLKESQASADRVDQIRRDQKTGKITQAQAVRLLNAETGAGADVVQNQKEIEKTMPTTGQLAAGFAGTAADIVTAGSFSKVKGAELLTKPGITAAKDLAPIFLKGGKTALVGRLGANGVAGGLNAAAGGGDEKSILENFGTGALFPEFLRIGGKKVVGAAKKVFGKGDDVVAKVGKKSITDDKQGVNAIVNQAIDEQSDKYGTGVLKRARNWLGDQIDPNRAFAKIDDAYAKANGIKRTKLNADQSVEDLARRSHSSEREAAGLFDVKHDVVGANGEKEALSARDLVIKYAGDSPAGKEFNNYTNAKFDLEFRAKHNGKRIQQGLDDDQLQNFVNEYEHKNPDALADAKVKKGVNNQAIDYLVKTKAMPAEEADYIKKFYEYAVPLERVFPDDLERTQVVGRNIGSISKQTVVQRLEGGSDIPLSNSFDTMLNRVYKAVSQGNRAKLAQKLLERQEEGLIPHSKVLITAGNKEARKTLRGQAQEMSKGIKYLNKRVVLTNRQVRKLDSEISKLNLEGLDASMRPREVTGPRRPVKTVTVKTVAPFIKDNAPKTLDDLKQSYGAKDLLQKEYGPGAKGMQQMAADIHNGGWTQLIALNPNMKKSTAISIAAQVLKKPTVLEGKTLVHEGQIGRNPSTRSVLQTLINAPTSEVIKVQKKLAVREPKLAAKLDEVVAYKDQVDSLRIAKQDLRDVTADFMDDPTTGKQVISGVINGESYKMEVPPDLAKAVQGMDQQRLTGVLKAFALMKKPFEVTWTGVLNPVFAALSFALYDTPMSVINSPQGFRTFGPKAVVEAFKSFNSHSEFQQALAKEGARPYGGSGASAFIKPDARSIAAQRSILSNFKYTASHPEVAISKLDVWGGKLANSTRTRIARAAYDDAIRMAKAAGEDVKDIAVKKRAMENATLAYRTVMPDYDTMSNLTRQINAVVPFYAASVAGTRSFGKALKRDPLGTGSKALALGIAPTVAITAYSLMQPQGQAFYSDMEAAGKKSVLDNNFIVVLPGAHKDDKTGQWTGIIKIPIAPEFRAINQTTWRETRKMMGGDGPNASHVGLSLFDFATGGVRTGENPLLTTRRILSGEDPQTGERLVKGDIADLPKNEQVYDSTSHAGKVVGGILHTSPIQGDKLLSLVGLVGDTARTGKPIESTEQNIKGRVSGAYGQQASSAFFDTYSPIKARRDAASKQVTHLLLTGKPNEAKRRAQEFNDTLVGSFSKFNDKYSNSDAYDPSWDDLKKGLLIKTTPKSFQARVR